VRRIRASVLALIPNPNLRYRLDEASGCRLWLGALDEHGYGVIGTSRSGTFRAHRVAWELRHGPVPAGRQLDHLCRNRSCVNPDHLEPVTNAENSRRGARAKLTWDAVRAIRRLASEHRVPHRRLAARFGVSNGTISKIVNHLLWREDAA
jgi:hypothetical protein